MKMVLSATLDNLYTYYINAPTDCVQAASVKWMLIKKTRYIYLTICWTCIKTTQWLIAFGLNATYYINQNNVIFLILRFFDLIP